ncbi:MAG TPA: hypothetical protein DCL61_07840 [Cyanobacteria bacterium UBA12227]|nr:hypothetical protein [Cyanobacteria bacterium UBA12227]HAX90501.1 hypothetical protein [Cyanobacteria bacterium UBA11370]HBY80233.1 hypothetical protein [Cyanobacteria bacterium UBA11148]
MNNLGLTQFAQRNYQKALEYFEEAIKLQPQISLYWYNKGAVLIELGRDREAIEANETALALNNNWPNASPSLAWNNRGLALENLNRFDEALQSYQQAIKLAPNETQAQTNLSNLENYLASNLSVENPTQQSSQADPEKNILETLLGAVQGAFNEDQTLTEGSIDLVISLIPIIGQVADARDLAAYLYRIVFKKQYNDPGNWVGLTLTLIGLVPVVGDITKFIGKIVLKEGVPAISRYLEDILTLIEKINPERVDINQLRKAIANNWDSGVKAGKELWNTALNQLSNWVNGIPELLFSQQKRQLSEAIQEVRTQSDGMLSQAFDQIRRKIEEGLDEIGRLLNRNGELVTPEGVRVPSDEGINGPLRIEGSGGSRGNFVPSQGFNELRQNAQTAIRSWNLSDAELQKISNLLESARVAGDNDLPRLIQETIQRSPSEAQGRVMQFVDTLSRRQQSIPSRFSIGNRPLAEGGQNVVFEMSENRNLLVKKPREGKGNFRDEYRALLRMEMMGIQTALVKKAELNGETVLILEKIPGAISKDIMDTREGPRYVHLVTEKTIQDLERIYETLQRNEVDIRDFQFMVREGDGAVIMVDPKIMRTDTPPEEDIERIINKFKEFNQR